MELFFFIISFLSYNHISNFAVNTFRETTGVIRDTSLAVQGKIISTRCYRKKLKFGYETGKTFIFTEAIIKVEDSSEQNLSEFITVLWPGGKIGNIVSTLKGFSPPAKEVRQLFFLNKNKTGDFVPVSMKGFTGKYLNKNIYFRGIKYRSETLKFFHRVSE